MRTPWQYWVLAVLGLVWFAGGAYDYVMTVTVNEPYLSILTPEQRAWMDARPEWFTALWAISIWASVLGALLMLARTKWAAKLFSVSMLAYIPCTVWSYGFASPSAYAVTGMFGAVFSAIIFLSILFFIGYVRRMHQRGVIN